MLIYLIGFVLSLLVSLITNFIVFKPWKDGWNFYYSEIPFSFLLAFMWPCVVPPLLLVALLYLLLYIWILAIDLLEKHEHPRKNHALRIF